MTYISGNEWIELYIASNIELNMSRMWFDNIPMMLVARCEDGANP